MLWLVVVAGLVSAMLLASPAPVALADDPLPDEVHDPFDEPEGSEREEPEGSSGLAAAEVDSAIADAVASGERVQVDSGRSEWDSLFAEPSGEVTLESSAAAVRTRLGAEPGQWRDIDTSLQVSPEDGGLVPVAPALELAFSSGGDGPLARIGRDGHSLELSWPDALPAPVVEGSSATFVGVLPGVDLVVSVFPDGTGFTEVLVVHSAEAATNPALAELELGLV